MAKRKPKPQPRPIAPPTKWIALAIAVVTVIVYWRAKSFGFVPYDDNDYVYENPMVLGGLTLEGLRWAFASGR